MKIIRDGEIDHYGKCEHCGCEFLYEKFDICWSHTEPDYYYVLCPKCSQIHWIKGTPELDQWWKEKLDNLIGHD